jgi:hypothetical protein
MNFDNKNEEISMLIANEFDTRMEAAIFSYILDKGMENLKEITEKEISELEENGLMTASFVQALVRTAVKICKDYTPMEIMVYIRMNCFFTPSPKELILYKVDYTEEGWSELCCQLDEDEEESEIEILVIK